MNHWRHGWFDTQQIACRGAEFKQMGTRWISGAQENVGDDKLSSLEIKQHSYRSRHGAKDVWQAMRRECWMAFSLDIMSALARHCSSQNVDC